MICERDIKLSFKIYIFRNIISVAGTRDGEVWGGSGGAGGPGQVSSHEVSRGVSHLAWLSCGLHWLPWHTSTRQCSQQCDSETHRCSPASDHEAAQTTLLHHQDSLAVSLPPPLPASLLSPRLHPGPDSSR